MMLALDDRRPAHLTEVRAALASLPEADQARLGVTEDWHGRPHQLTYRQVERTHRLIAKALGKDSPDGAPSAGLQAVCDQLLEASIPAGTRQEHGAGRRLDRRRDLVPAAPARHQRMRRPRGAWGHRNANLPGPKGEMFSATSCRPPSWSPKKTAPPSPSWPGG